MFSNLPPSLPPFLPSAPTIKTSAIVILRESHRPLRNADRSLATVGMHGAAFDLYESASFVCTRMRVEEAKEARQGTRYEKTEVYRRKS